MNIFENAKFGDKFLAENNHIMLYVGIDEGSILMVRENQPHMYLYDANGLSHCGSNYNIVSKYQEEVDEWELDKLAQQAMIKNVNPSVSGDIFATYKIGFEDDYKKAKEY